MIFFFEGAPILVSQPHFLNADAKYLDGLSGLNPDRAEHGIYLLIEPVSEIICNKHKKSLMVILVSEYWHATRGDEKNSNELRGTKAKVAFFGHAGRNVRGNHSILLVGRGKAIIVRKILNLHKMETKCPVRQN